MCITFTADPVLSPAEVLRDHSELTTINRMNIRESLASARLHLWDENSKRLMSFAQVRAQQS